MLLDPEDRIKLEISAACVRELLNSMEVFPDLYIEVYSSSMDRRSKVELSEEFFRIIGKKGVYALDSGKDEGPGVSVMAIYLNGMEYTENGIFHFAIAENYSLSQNYLHEFRISTEGGKMKSVEYLFSSEL